MIRHWVALALLSSSWLLGLKYYHEPDWVAWVAVVLVGSALLVRPGVRAPARGTAALAAALLLPALWVLPWPWRLGFLLLVVGSVLWALPIPSRWLKGLGSAAVAAGVIFLGQALAMELYANVTGRSHELPWPLPRLLGLVTGLLGMQAGVYGSEIALWAMRQVSPLGATWELFLDPPTFCFLVGGLILLALQAWSAPSAERWRSRWGRPAAALAVAVLVWLPIRSGLFMALYLHRLLRTEYEDRLNLMPAFWSPWVHLLLLVPPVFLAWRFARPAPAGQPLPADAPPEEPATPAPSAAPRWRHPAAALLAGMAAAVFTFALFWNPMGARNPGRVLVDEEHSTWEPTQKPYDTEWYGQDAGYNYACIYDYCSRFYEMGRLTTPIGDEDTLADCDVLIIKVPTKRYTAAEVARILRFVERGGGLVFFGEHTDVFRVSTHINDIAQAFGFVYHMDCAFGVDSVFEEHSSPALIPHPITQYMPFLDWEISCTLAPGLWSGRTALLGTGLFMLTADYHASNFYPQVEFRADMRYGACVQLLSTHYGAGRVVAFTDSTQPSNFSAFTPGKAELVLGMIEWANHRNPAVNPRWLLVPLGLVLGLAAIALAWGSNAAWLTLLAAGVLGWTVSVPAVRVLHRTGMPEPRNVRPMVRIVMDRTVNNVALPDSGFIDGKPMGFGIFERWILRLGYFTSRRSGADALRGDLLVVPYPTESSNPEYHQYRDQIARYVEAGGKLLVLDSPENAKSSANTLLWPYGVTVKREGTLSGTLLKVPAGWPSTVTVEAACEVTGGKPFAELSGKPVAASVAYGKGTVTVIGFGSRFCDAKYGYTGDVEPDPTLRRVFDLQFKLFRGIISGALDAAPARPPRTEGD